MPLNDTVHQVTERIRARSRSARTDYLERMARAADAGPARAHLSCGNLAHAFAASPDADKARQAEGSAGNIGIVTAYNDMLSAHQPFEGYPALIREAARQAGGTAQVAGGVPAMCDGVTQGQPGMELSLFSRDVIALAAGVALSHNCFDAAIFLGVCDKIVPGLVIAAATFGHIPAIFAPAGPMTSGLPNDEKAAVRQRFARGEIGRDELMAAEMASYHGPGTCTFYGTANSNQMLMEFMGLHLPGASFVNPGTPLREALTRAAARRALEITAAGNSYTPASAVLDERAFVNGMIGLHATGGSTNLTLHLVAMARAAGVLIDWSDMADAFRRHAADGAGLSQRAGRREPFSCRRRARLHDRRAAPGRAPARRRPHGRGRRAGPIHAGAGAGRRWARLARRHAREPERQDPAPGGRSLPAHRRAHGAQRQSRPGGDQDLGSQAGAPCRGGPGPGVPRSERDQGRVPGRRARTRLSSACCASRARRPTACPSCTH